jgi:hypothetical protein
VGGQQAAGLSEGQVAELVEDDEVEPGQIIGEPSLPAGAGFVLQSVDEIDNGVEAASGTMVHRDRLAKSGLPLDIIDFLAQHFQNQPLLLGRRQLVLRHGERLCRSAKPSRIARIQVRVGQDGIQPGNLCL